MRCAVCNTDNPDAAVACRSCGSPLAVEAPAASEQVLTTGTVLQGGAFVVEGVLGQGGFGIPGSRPMQDWTRSALTSERAGYHVPVFRPVVSF